MSFSRQLPFPTRQPEPASQTASISNDLYLNIKLMSPLSPGNYQQFFNLSPISPSTIPVVHQSIEEVAGLPTSVQAPKTADSNIEAISAQDVKMNTERPSPSFFAPLFESTLAADEFTNLEAWLYDHNLVSPTQFTTQQTIEPNFFANLPNPVFDTHVFGKPLTPTVATFADLEIDPLIRYEQGPFGIIHAQPMRWEQGNFGIMQTRPDYSQEPQTSYPEPNQAVQQQHPYYSQQSTAPYGLQSQLPYQQHYHEHKPAPYALMQGPILPSQAVQVRTTTPIIPANAPIRDLKRKAPDHTDTAYPAERPTKAIFKPHIRTSAKTKGLTTRTGKINHYSPSKDGGYVTLPQPHAWKDANSGLIFSYNIFGELFSPSPEHSHSTLPHNDGMHPEITFTVAELTTYLLSPSNPTPPTLFLQRTPADSARRYPTTTSALCRFHSCPAHGGKIGVGSYRVAIDQRWASHGSSTDPFVVAGYVHLYCLERFCDVPGLVQKGVKIVVDERVMKQEPKGNFLPSLFGCHEAVTARAFFAALCSQDAAALRSIFPAGGYAIHDRFSTAPKPHQNTLTYLMHKRKIDKMAASRIRQQTERGLNKGNVLVHLGDLEVSERAREEGGGVGGGGRFRVEGRWREGEFRESVRGGWVKRRERGERVVEDEVEDEEVDEEEEEEEEWVPARPMKRVRRG